ncbi:MAG: energy transducer TonB [Nitrospiraceae bacterium]|nr:MAG: energy transducer TonB [Nitrospiraceae bacterium]
MISSSYRPSVNIFDVDVIAPFDTDVPEVREKNKPVPEKRNKPVLVKKRRPPLEENVKPDTLFDEDTGAATSKKSALAKVESADRMQHKNQEEYETPAFSSGDKDRAGEESSEVKLVPPSVLFDRNTINKYASKGPSQSKGLTFDAPEFKNRGYMRLLKDKIENIWKYPKGAARLGRSGDLYILFSIKRDGRLGKVELVRTSGYRELDEAAIKAVKDAQPYWPLPDDWEKDELDINGHFIYVFGTTYLM